MANTLGAYMRMGKVGERLVRSARTANMLTGMPIFRQSPSSARFSSVTGGMEAYPKDLVIRSKEKKDTATCIFLHGLGDTGRGWEDGAQFLSATLPHVKFILPTANSMAVTLNMGMKMPAWYDLEGLDLRSNEKCQGIDDSMERISDLIQKEVSRGRSMQRIVLAGFSQGGALSLYAGLRQKEQLAGIDILSTPIRLFHGDADDVVKLEYAHDSLAYLKKMGCKDTGLKEYGMLPHSASIEELKDVRDFIASVLPDNGSGIKPKL
eukprot:jgi/Bigna1/136878/aug1.36_g11586